MRLDPDMLIPACPKIRIHASEVPRRTATRRATAQLGLAAVLDDADQTITCGDLTLAANSNVRWLAAHRTPAHRPGSRPPVQRVTVSRACLRFGMPTLSFAERPGASPDVMRLPVSDPSVRSVADRLIGSLASNREGTDGRNRFPTCGFPQAYLGFSAGSAKELFGLATRQQAIGRTLPCQTCGRDIDVARLFAGESGDLGALAACPVCGRVQRWPLGHAVPTRFTRHVPIGFIRRFCRAIADRLPLAATGASTYCGTRSLSPARDWPNLPNARTRRLDLLAHEFRCAISGEQRFVYLPRSAVVEAKPGQRLDAGQVWCRVMAAPPDAEWRWLARPLQYTSAERVLGGDALADHLKAVWFDHQGITCAELGEHQRLWPADLVAFAADGPLRPLGLYWDFTPARRQTGEPILVAAVFAPVRFAAFGPWRTTLPGEVALDAEWADPRQRRVGPRRETPTRPAIRLARPVRPRRLAS